MKTKTWIRACTESFFKGSLTHLPSKTVVVTSAESSSGKTSLIETIVGKTLEWSESELCSDRFPDAKIKCASVEYDDHIINIIEIPPISGETPYPKEITDLIVKADLVAELHCLNTAFELSWLTDLFEQKIDNQPISSIIKNRKVFAYTKADEPDPLLKEWCNLSDEKRAELNEMNAVSGNPKFSTYFDAVMYDRTICMGLYPYECPEGNIFETSILTRQGIDALTAKCRQILFP